MTELMELLYDYARDHYFSGYIDQQAYRQLQDLESQNLSSLRRSLSAAQSEALEHYQHARYSQQQLELEAMFQAACKLARELSL